VDAINSHWLPFTYSLVVSFSSAPELLSAPMPGALPESISTPSFGHPSSRQHEKTLLLLEVARKAYKWESKA
jgi:hypothetical protein